jgi:hypothetical protein
MLASSFWVVTHRKGGRDTGLVVGFSTAEAVSRYLGAPRAGLCQVRLVREDMELVMLVADMHRDGAAEICFDPEPDGSGGEMVSLIDLFQRKGFGGGGADRTDTA